MGYVWEEFLVMFLGQFHGCEALRSTNVTCPQNHKAPQACTMSRLGLAKPSPKRDHQYSRTPNVRLPTKRQT
ncbi:hypothetical protein PIB30_093514, partial [Stylosanthes scabra]|nr:hypothetical protein [Stylosanthes scabra]